jgi:hypothetical protein
LKVFENSRKCPSRHDEPPFTSNKYALRICVVKYSREDHLSWARQSQD